MHSIPARTVLVTNLPKHLRGERPLAEYFENMGLAVESVNVCREVDSLKVLLDARTKALLALERMWVDYVGNPSTVEEYDPESNAMPLVDTDVEGGTSPKFVVPHKPRPTIRIGWQKVDALDYLEHKFKEADEHVKKKRRAGKFKATGSAFVTFEKMSSAVSASVVHFFTLAPLNTLLANCGPGSPCSQSLSNINLSRTRTSRYRLGKYDSILICHTHTRCRRPRSYGVIAVILVYPYHRSSWLVELPRNQEDNAMAGEPH